MKVTDETGLQPSRQQEIKALQHFGCTHLMCLLIERILAYLTILPNSSTLSSHRQLIQPLFLTIIFNHKGIFSFLKFYFQIEKVNLYINL